MIIQTNQGQRISTTEEPRWNDFHQRFYVWGFRWVKSQGRFSGTKSLWNFTGYEQGE